MGSRLDQISLSGFKSIKSLNQFKLDPEINVLIGANGAGKSNFVEFFRMLRAMLEQRLQTHVLGAGGADGYFHFGIKETKQISAELLFGANRHATTWTSTADGKLLIEKEIAQYTGKPDTSEQWVTNGALESGLADRKNARGLLTERGPNWWVHDALAGWQVYHFHDTSMTAGMRRDVGVDQGKRLASNAHNLAAFLHQWKKSQPDRYRLLIGTIQRVAPYFSDFEFIEKSGSIENTVRLTWHQKGSDYIHQPGHFSDGTIRFICLAACLLQPEPPTTIVLDEPEIGLHPQALTLLAGLMRSASKRMQIIVATQSPVLLGEFKPEQIITVNQRNGCSELERLNHEELKDWISEYSIGDLWQKGVIQGGVNVG